MFYKYYYYRQLGRFLFLSKVQVYSIACCIRETGKFPKPVVIEKKCDKYRVIDGFHRLSVFFYLIGCFKIDSENIPCFNVDEEQDYWIAEQ